MLATPTRLGALAALTLIPAIALAGSSEVDFVAVVDVLDLDNQLVEDAGLLDYDGPVVVAHTAPNEDGVLDYWLRFDHVAEAGAPLAGVAELSILDERYDEMPAILTDRLDAVAIVDSLAGQLAAEDVRAIIDPMYVDERALEELNAWDADSLVAVGKDFEHAVRSSSGLAFAPPNRTTAASLEASVAPFYADDYRGLLCEGAILDTCAIATRFAGGLWIDWVVGPAGGDGSGSNADAGDDVETEVEETEADDADEEAEADTATGSAPTADETDEAKGGDDTAVGSTEVDAPEAPEEDHDTDVHLDTHVPSDTHVDEETEVDAHWAPPPAPAH